MSYLYTILFLMCFAMYEAKRLDNRQWITKAEKNFSWIFRAAFIFAAAENFIQFFSILLIFMNYDLFLNYFRKDIKDLWHLGQGDTAASWDMFWRHNLEAYKIFRYFSLLLALALAILSYHYGVKPNYLEEGFNYLQNDY